MMTERSAEISFRSARVVHVVMPPHEPDGYTSTSEPFAIGVSFTGHAKAVVEDGFGHLSELTFPAGTCGINGFGPTTWLRVREPSEAVEIHASPDELVSVSEDISVDWHDHPAFLQPGQDAVIWGVCARLRMAMLGTMPLDALEADSLVRGLLVHVAVRYLHAQPPRRMPGRLDQRRLSRVAEFIEGSLHRPPSLREMADVAAMSSFHFQRLFRATTGLSPHAYVMARRMENARRLLDRPGMSVAAVAERLGFSDRSHFRRSFHRQFNVRPRTQRSTIGAA